MITKENKKILAITLAIILITNMVLLGMGLMPPTYFWGIVLIIFFISNKFFGLKNE